MELRDYQLSAIQSIYDYYRTKDGNPILVEPTGAGKSVIIGKFVEGVVSHNPEQRILMVTHVKELVEQNYLKLMTIWPDAPAGINAASLKQRDTDSQIIFASIQSVYKNYLQLGRFNLILIDECHLIPHKLEGMYHKLINGLKRFNQNLKVIGFTATPFRMTTGHLIGPGSLFTDICHETKMKTLIERGHLCKVLPKHTQTQLDVSGVNKRGGEYIASQLEKAIDTDDINHAAVNEIIKAGKDRKSWLVFCSGVDHAHHVRDILKSRGVVTEVVTGKTSIHEREQIINDYKAGNIKALVNMNVLTTGFDAPATDLLACLRPTGSTGLWVQMIGRGMRPAAGKENCLVLDFAANTERHGHIDDIDMAHNTPNDEPGAAPVKICPECESYNHAGVRYCSECGYEFPEPETKLKPKASTAQLLSFEEPALTNITRIDISVHHKEGKPPSLRLDLFSGLRFVCCDFLCLEHGGYATEKAKVNYQKYFKQAAPDSTLSAYDSFIHKSVEVDLMIRTKKNGKYTNVTDIRSAA